MAGGSKAGMRRGRRPVIVAGILAAVALLAAGGLFVLRATGPSGRAPDAGELRALSEKLDEVESTLRPIAVSFTAEPATGAIDVTSYRERVGRARGVVDATSDLEVSSPETLEVRDLILTGGSQVVSGMDIALDALVSDESTGAETAAALVEDGQATLQEARDRLMELLATSAD